MKKNEVQIGATYQVSVTGKLAPVKIVRENPHGGWNGVNVDTKREVRIKSAQRLRKRLDATPRALPSERLGVPPTTPDVDLKVKAAEDATAPKPIPGAQDAPGAARPSGGSGAPRRPGGRRGDVVDGCGWWRCRPGWRWRRLLWRRRRRWWRRWWRRRFGSKEHWRGDRRGLARWRGRRRSPPCLRHRTAPPAVPRSPARPQ